MKIYHPYFSFLRLPFENMLLALEEYRALCWMEPDEDDKIRDTVISRQRLDFYRWMYLEGKLHD